MTENSNNSPARAATVGVTIGVGFVAMVLSASGTGLLDRPLWMDEIHTWLIVTDSSLSHAMTALSHGADYNPPTYFLFVRLFGLMAGTSPIVMRLFSVLAMAIGLGFTGATLARRFRPMVAIAATSAVAMQPLIVQQATEARFYSLWFALFAGFCFVRSKADRGLLPLIAESVLAVLVATVHYFGVLSLGLVFLLDWKNQRPRTNRERVYFAAPYAAGVFALLGCLGFYFGQRSSLTISTWISPPGVDRTYSFFLEFLPILPLALAAVGWMLTRENTDTEPESQEPTTEPQPTPNRNSLAIAGFGMPLVLLAFSLTIQPALVERYAIVCFVAWPFVFATMMERVKYQFAIGFTVVCLFFGADNSRDLVARYRAIDSERQRIAAELQSLDDVVVFEDRIDHYPAAFNKPDATWFLMDFDDGTKGKTRLRIVQRDVARAVRQFYPQFATRKLGHLIDNGHASFIVVPYRSELADENSEANINRLKHEYPTFAIERIARRIFRFTHRSLPAAATNTPVSGRALAPGNSP